MQPPSRNSYLTLTLCVLLPLACDDSTEEKPQDASPATETHVHPTDQAVADLALDGPALKDTSGADQATDAVVTDAAGDLTAPDMTAPDMTPPDMGPPDMGPGIPAPAAYWSMDSAHISSGTIQDRVGAVDGTITGAVEDSGGKVGQALALSGAGDFIDFDDQLGALFAGADKAFSVSMWVKPVTLSVNVVLMSKSGDTACDPNEDQRSWVSSLNSTGKPIFAFQPLSSGSTQLVSAVNPLTGAGVWTHLMFVYDGAPDTGPGDRVSIYLNGAALAETPISTGTFPFDLEASAARLAFGVRLSSTGAPCTDSGAGFFAGSVDELAIWGSALSAAEVGTVYARGDSGGALVP